MAQGIRLPSELDGFIAAFDTSLAELRPCHREHIIASVADHMARSFAEGKQPCRERWEKRNKPARGRLGIRCRDFDKALLEPDVAPIQAHDLLTAKPGERANGKERKQLRGSVREKQTQLLR